MAAQEVMTVQTSELLNFFPYVDEKDDMRHNVTCVTMRALKI